MRGLRATLILALVLTAFHQLPVLAVEATAADEQLANILGDYWEYYLQENPVAATGVGVKEFNDRLPSVTNESKQRQIEIEKGLLRRTRDIERAALSIDGRVNAELFEWVLEDSIGENELGLQRIPFNTFFGFFMNALTASSSVSMESVDDYEDYLARMQDIPRYFSENLNNMRKGASDGFVLPQIVIDGVLPTLDAQLKADPEDSSFYDPFEKMSAKLSNDEKDRLREDGRNAIRNDVMPAFADVAEFLRSEYQASESLGAEQLPDGEAYYAYQIRRYTTLTDTSADEIHATGLAEVTRIRNEMQTIIDDLEFEGDFEAFTEFLVSDPQFFAATDEELLQITAYTAKRIDYLMPGYFGKLPRQSYGIVPVPEEIAPNYTTGAYYGAPLNAKNGGAFWINTFALDQRPLYEIPALTLHEAVPGHHHQNALAKELENVPAFRRSLGFSAFGEGWALYSEKLGVEMGVYRTPYEHFGRLSYEMWRACRLVIDTGIHSEEWTREEAINFLMRNTALSAGNARAEIDRYISWPGQALSYKLGELKIWELRRRAESDLGDDFDLRQFHDAVLGNGALPMSMLDGVIDRYIDSALTAREH
ncbi:MAG: DUF885 domain-containing protein [Woeseiaceae bacterium]